ncbi:hypothetical protein CU254_41005 (plasmid) [Amycolatopsis sp. AA4]|uniref:hypothetical protein n=1 Tax=Actinomycetes TaxID=1760 RepID=UPI0001B56181|nr:MULTISPECIES: hypothetical protein [Actinomycetes]ATY16974.1 hypothetical protein CU254_41005 [Amycolatopsis sp. AA4]
MADNVRELRPSRVPWDLAAHARPGVRFVAPGEYLAGVPFAVRRSMVKMVMVEALAAAADEDGVILDFSPPEFFGTHVAGVLNRDLEEDEEPATLVYDQFTAMTVISCMGELAREDGLLANRGNGDTADYRLTLPEELS